MKMCHFGKQLMSGSNLIVLYGSVFLLGLIIDVHTVRIGKGPQDISVVKGARAELSCFITDQGSQDFIFWKKTLNQSFPDMISYNDWALNTSRYLITLRYGQYKLFIREVSLSDEGVYECQAGAETARATLTVTVPVYNMSLEWDSQKPFPRDSLVNITCKAFHSRPPADITWLLETRNVSGAASYNISYDDNGYGDVISTLTVDTGSGVAGMPYKCIAKVPGQRLEDAPFLFDYVTVFGVASSGNKLQAVFVLQVLTLLFLRTCTS